MSERQKGREALPRTMAGIYRLGTDRGVVTVGAQRKLTFRLGALEMLLAGTGTREVPLHRTRDEEGGAMTLSKTGRTLLVSIVEPRRLFLCKADDARAFLKGTLSSVELLDVTERDEGSPPPKEAAEERLARMQDLARRTQERLGRTG